MEDTLGRVLALDYGTKRVGWAVSDRLRMIVSEAGTVSYHSDEQLWEEMTGIVEGFEVAEFVIGYPLNMDGSVGDQARIVDVFIETLEKHYRRPVHRCDERLSSSAAEQMIRDTGTRKQRRDKALIDTKAAIIILNEYLGIQTHG